ncbi:(deoxy)nucleoside triphosphate pyrophosphohydrolase [Priestia megaterium]|jgi:8-oxo-dGTP diphosphatase|uniref:(deoxy)nucleoside triphosphate pyrophosphohydrolase n=1 Tax=Priestia TaxID=2800373 RepID=UPI000BF789F8|nr:MULTISPECIES: (deoxy)nucleoside triphosphate pyrophosphohydrolase [Priestia]MBZ5482577.1 (deoxy)nucleoside triphosphate pyrophosphohydrolase [Bacillus sp. T_4]MCG0050167.1 (deoxy)nucleoside triphosphate pyrophosphohydrolase [Priestia aryabhattai]MDH3161377.1 (deoxy)nucleoside triphosphate pyrophosphohydrolase [Priestia megaterium]MED4115209.1 (deoxy)nucleoside triphosphate pyrophosphohydrolase [Priestia megaterium]PEX08491.1 8-oxo-dGTP diphosphatase MutT [Priestia megaterium]
MKKVTAAIIKDKNRLLIAKRHSKDPLGGKWEFPGGKIEPGETPQDCLVREIKEELGVEVKIGPFYDDNVYNSQDHGIHLLFYWAEIIKGEVIPVVHDDLKWITINELASFDFAPADIPIVKKLMKEDI